MITALGKWMLGLFPESTLLFRGCRYYVNRYNGDNNCNCAENGEVRVLHQRLPRATCVFDIGANVGDWTRFALTIHPALQVHCFEPSQKTFERLRQQNFPANVTCSNIGMAAAPGQAKLFAGARDSTTSSIFARDGFTRAADSSEAITLDSVDHYCAERNIGHIDFVKVDVEGYELEVLKGMRQLLSSGSIDAVQFEYGGSYLDARIQLKDVFDFFRATNPAYALHKICPRRLLPVPQYAQTYETFQYSNWLALKQDAGATR